MRSYLTASFFMSVVTTKKQKKTSPRKAYKKPAKKVVKRKYNYTRQPNNAIQIDIPECSQHYIKSLYDPWQTIAGVCIPCDLFPLPSQKVKVTKRFSLKLSSNGCGWVTLAPSLASDYSAGAYNANNEGNAGDADSLFNAAGSWGTTPLYFTDLPYTVAELETEKSVQGRVVAAGIRAKYAGTELNRGGSYVALEEQDHQDLYATTNFNSINFVRSFSNAYITSPKSESDWDISVSYSGPINPDEIDFQGTPAPLGLSTSDNFMILCFSGSTAMAGEMIEVEVCQHVEYIGKKAVGKTVSHADTKTYGKVLETTKEQAAVAPIKPSGFAEGFRTFIDKVIQAAPKLINVAMGAGTLLTTGNPLPLLGAGAQMFSASTVNEKLMIKG